MSRAGFTGPLAGAVLALGMLLAPMAARAGGPVLVGGPGFGVPGQAFTWDAAKMPIQYRIDPGPMSVNPSGTVIISHTQGVARVQNMFGVWQSVPTANLSYANAGAILAASPGYTGGDVSTATQFNAIVGSCNQGKQNPIIFDANGKILSQLGVDPAVIGFSQPCAVNAATGHFTSDLLLLNGKFQDGVNNSTNFELTANQFNEAIAHEIGHLSGLDHSQINAGVLSEPPGQCNLGELAGLPLMFPIAQCQARADVGMPVLAPDDVAWISQLYPVSGTPPAGKVLTASVYTTISGQIFFADGTTLLQGVNLVARDTGNLPAHAVSVVSGFLFTGNPGQSVTANYLPCTAPGSGICPASGFLDDNRGGDSSGSRDPSLIGFYQIPVPATSTTCSSTPCTYVVEAESIDPSFSGGSSLGPLDPPVPVPGVIPSPPPTVPVSVGTPASNVDITIQNFSPTFDVFESVRLWLPKMVPRQRREQILGQERPAG